MSVDTDFNPKNREWVSFEEDGGNRTWLLDVTFLTSSWNCLYANGCKGVLTEDSTELMQGCCSYGAHFVDKDDAIKILDISKRMSGEDWQFKKEAEKLKGPIKWAKNPKSSISTRLKDGACIFLNRPDFPLGPGCALHQFALKNQEAPMEYKPEVCWQLPLRREDLSDESGHITSRVTSWERRDWGAGGSEFHWWCTEERSAYSNQNPVYISLQAELGAIMGEEILERFKAYLIQRETSKTNYLPIPKRGHRQPSK